MKYKDYHMKMEFDEADGIYYGHVLEIDHIIRDYNHDTSNTRNNARSAPKSF